MADGTKSWVLAIDTSAVVASIALAPAGVDPGEAGAEFVWRAGRNQTATLLSQIDSLMRLCGIHSDELGAVAVAIGPGSFNTLRVGLSTAKAFSFAHDIPIIGIGTLDAAAYAFRQCEMPVRAFLDAGRGRVVTGDYRVSGDRMVLHGGLEHRTRNQLADGIIERTILAGELSAADAEHLASFDLVQVPAPSIRRRRASILLDMAYPRWCSNDGDDLFRLEPIYVHSRPQRRSGEEFHS